MEELKKINNKRFVNNDVSSSTVFVLNTMRYENYEIIVKKSRDGYAVIGKEPILTDETQRTTDFFFDDKYYKCYNDFEVVKCVANLGRQLTRIFYDAILEQNKSTITEFSVFSGSIILHRIDKDKLDKAKPILLKWLHENGMPFQNDIEQIGKYAESRLLPFIDISIAIYVFLEITDLLKLKQYDKCISQNEQRHLDYIAKIIKCQNVRHTLDDIINIINLAEKHITEPDLKFKENLRNFNINQTNHIRVVRYYSNILSAAWHKMKLLICQDIENKIYKRCCICGNIFEISSNKQKYCDDCQDEKKREKYRCKYRKILDLHQQLVDEYNKINKYDEDIDKIVKLVKHSEIKKYGIKKLRKSLDKLHSL